MTFKAFRKLHGTLAPFVLLPLVVTVTTGVTYRIGKDWFGWTRDQVHWLMVIHEGEYWGKTLEPFYVLFNGLGLLWMVVTGAAMAVRNIQRSAWFRAWQASRVTAAVPSPANPDAPDAEDRP
ncbi:hypothetical protein [Prochlorothrix hollandica]|uniref:Peptidase n=1 Tax=Prochlorothrix hollandica PCC 9006 = CALU 1027 TaxID=317619 RepID=A0A0M2PWP3_PROHO|nr:hypothetical protein [Prochlorothrix hollandica]KKI99103.1 peptidase [Prochlorothrix hollandica PCC 9006 = CALU 1027]